MSKDMAILADKLSRSKTTDKEALKKKILHVPVQPPTGALIDWANTLCKNYNPPLLLIADIENKLSKPYCSLFTSFWGFCPEMEVSTTEKKKGFGNMSE